MYIFEEALRRKSPTTNEKKGNELVISDISQPRVDLEKETTAHVHGEPTLPSTVEDLPPIHPGQEKGENSGSDHRQALDEAKRKTLVLVTTDHVTLHCLFRVRTAKKVSSTTNCLIRTHRRLRLKNSSTSRSTQGPKRSSETPSSRKTNQSQKNKGLVSKGVIVSSSGSPS